VTDRAQDSAFDSSLAPPQPRDRAGIRPPLDLANVARQVQVIQKKLAEERLAKKAEKKGNYILDSLGGLK